MASSLYPNSNLTPEALARQGDIRPEDPSTGEVMDSVFFNIENNSFKLIHSNLKGDRYDEESIGNLLEPSEIWDKYGVKVEQPISSRNAERMRDNLDEVARRDFNINTLERTSLNQARLFINQVGGAIITDPVQWGLAAVSGGLFAVAGNTLGKIPAISSAVKGAGTAGRIGVAGATGAAAGFIEGTLESEILKSQAPKAGLQFTDEDYWTNIRANVYFGGALGALGRAGFEAFGSKTPDQAIRDSINSNKVDESYNLVNANKRPHAEAPKQDIYTSNMPEGEYYNTHFSPNKEYNRSTQNPVSDLDLGEGYSFTSSRDYAFSDKGYAQGMKEDVFQLDLGGSEIKLFDADGVLAREDLIALTDILSKETEIPKEVLDEILKGQVPVKVLSDVLSSMDKVKGTNSNKYLRDIIKGKGFNGYSFKEGRLSADGKDLKGMHLFEMPKESSVRHLNPDLPPARTQDTSSYQAKRVEQQKKLDYYVERESDLDYDVSLMDEFEKSSTSLPNDPDLEFQSDVAGIKEVSDSFIEDANYIRQEAEANGQPIQDVEGADMTPEKSREVAKATDFCVRN